ncbi:DUF3826 domain-containing protein [Segetibacter sp. 3557_3]|nr:DUF3826 domain-containing protein [Segetibacter sp. 3557_3]
MLLVLLFLSLSLFSQSAGTDTTGQAAYLKTITERAQKIVNTLGINDSRKATTVRDLIAGQYKNLNDIHTSRDNRIKALKAGTALDKEALNLQVKQVQDEASAQIDKLHVAYLSSLSRNLNPEQVDKVKDGMTYDVVHVTYKATLEMIPSLTEAQKKQIMLWLVEAREHAMDAESSQKKHEWFGKYKGKINNYLSAAGYNLTKEREEWVKRINASKPNTSNK